MSESVKCPLCKSHVIITRATPTAIWYTCPNDELTFARHYILLEDIEDLVGHIDGFCGLVAKMQGVVDEINRLKTEKSKEARAANPYHCGRVHEESQTHCDGKSCELLPECTL